jgi:hypothetical protein
MISVTALDQWVYICNNKCVSAVNEHSVSEVCGIAKNAFGKCVYFQFGVHLSTSA